MKILIFKVNQLGDNIVFKPVVDYLTDPSLGHEIFLFTSPTAKPLYDGLVHPERVFAFPTRKFNDAWKNPFFFARLVALVRKIRPDVCILAEDQGNVAHFLSSCTGASCRVGSFGSFLKWRRGLTVDVQPGEDTNHAAWGWALLKAFVRTTADTTLPDAPPPPDLTRLIRRAPVLDFLIHAGGSRAYKRWFPERFVELANRLAATHRVGWNTTSETHQVGGLDKRVERIETPFLADLVSAIATARVFIGNNSGPMNIAQALGTPSVIFCGPSRRNWDPFWHSDRMLLLRDETLSCICCDSPEGPLNRCTNTNSPMACMTSWTVNEVAKRCLHMFETREIMK